MSRLLILLAACLLALPAMALAQTTPEDAVRGHFAAIAAEDYLAADQYFSAAFQRAFKPDVSALNAYYLARFEQVSRGYQILAIEPLADEQVQADVLTVEFADTHPEAPVGVTERIYYYLLREKVAESAPGRDSDGYAWRIDIFDSIKFATLAEARRRPYLYTKEAWPEAGSSELRSEQGLFHIQAALDSFYAENGQYPFRLLGGDNRRDELIAAGKLLGTYPQNGFANRPMRAVEFGERSSGDFSYYSVDAEGDGIREGYWLVLHGKVPEHYYFDNRDAIYLVNESMAGSQFELAEQFATFWAARGGEQLAISQALIDRDSEVAAAAPLINPGVPDLTAEAAGEAAPPAETTPEPAAAGTAPPAEGAPIPAESVTAPAEGEEPSGTAESFPSIAGTLAEAVRAVAHRLLPVGPPSLEYSAPSPEALTVRSFGFR